MVYYSLVVVHDTNVDTRHLKFGRRHPVGILIFFNSKISLKRRLKGGECLDRMVDSIR